MLTLSLLCNWGAGKLRFANFLFLSVNHWFPFTQLISFFIHCTLSHTTKLLENPQIFTVAHPYISHIWPYPKSPVTYGWNLYLPTEPYEFFDKQQMVSFINACRISLKFVIFCLVSVRKQPTFGDATTHFLAKWRLRNECRNSILMTRHYPDLGSGSDCLCRVGNLIQPIRSTTQIWVVMRHQYGISVLVSQTSFGGETSGNVTTCWLFTQATT